jgi:hypothetical protein
MFSKSLSYIKHRPPLFKNYSRWLKVYWNDLLILYSILQDVIAQRYPDIDIIWNQELFNSFCRMIYKTSSKHIPKYI